MQRLLAPRVQNASSRPWSFMANVVGASPLLSGKARYFLYRYLGISTGTDLIGPGCYFHSSRISIGRDTLVNHGCHFENVAPIVIGERCSLGLQVMLMTSTHRIGRHHLRPTPYRFDQVRIGDGCWIGARATLLPGVTVGDRCVVAAGAVVVEDCEADGLYAGVPARRIRDIEFEG